jgi:hypothetical protein
MIYCFGNSHVSIFSGSDKMVPIWPSRSIDHLPWFKTFRLGGCTAYQAMKHISDILELVEVNPCLIGFNKETDTILLVFGEVDVRAHIVLQAEKQNRTVDSITLEVVDRYFEAIMALYNRGFKVAVFGCVGGYVLQEGDTGPPWPHSGTLEQRNGATRLLNDSIENLCSEVGISFVSVFEEMLEKDRITTKIKYLDMNAGKVHITTRMLPIVLWKFRDIGLIPWEDVIAPYEFGVNKLEWFS